MFSPNESPDAAGSLDEMARSGQMRREVSRTDAFCWEPRLAFEQPPAGRDRTRLCGWKDPEGCSWQSGMERGCGRGGERPQGVCANPCKGCERSSLKILPRECSREPKGVFSCWSGGKTQRLDSSPWVSSDVTDYCQLRNRQTAIEQLLQDRTTTRKEVW